MNTSKRATVNFEPDLLGALRLRAAADDRSISELVNDAVRAFLARDSADLSSVTRQLDTIYAAPGANVGLDRVLAELQFMTLVKRAAR